jgi:hypothetical protein
MTKKVLYSSAGLYEVAGRTIAVNLYMIRNQILPLMVLMLLARHPLRMSLLLEGNNI